MQHTAPACAGDQRFTSDEARLDNTLTPELIEVCWSCPLLTACNDYAESVKPAAGFWAGRWFTPIPRGEYLRRAKQRARDEQTASTTDSEKTNNFPYKEIETEVIQGEKH